MCNPSKFRFVKLWRGRWLSCWLFILLGCCAQAETAGRVFLMNGQEVPGWLQEVSDEGLVFKTNDGREGTIPKANIREIRVQLPAGFQTALDELGEGAAEEAIRVLEGYADSSDPANLYPIPGNLASRASYHLFLHHRERGDAVQAGRWAQAYDPDLLPQAPPEARLGLYAKLAETPGDDFFDEAEASRQGADAAGVAEIDFLVAVAHELRGELSEALAAHGRVYSPRGSLLNPFGERALDRSIELLQGGSFSGIARPEGLLEGLIEIRDGLYGSGRASVSGAGAPGAVNEDSD